MNDSGPMDVDMHISTMELTLNRDALTVDKEKGEAHTPSSMNVYMVEAPSWLSALNVDMYLQDSSDVKAWHGLVNSLYRFEAVNTINGVSHYSCSTGLLTYILAESTHYFASPTGCNVDKVEKEELSVKGDAKEFRSVFKAWWIAIQPSWRLANDSSFNYKAPKDEDWRVLHKGGSAGLYTVVVVLLWWIRSLGPKSLSFRAWTAVRDVHWVIEEITYELGKSKKYILSLYI